MSTWASRPLPTQHNLAAVTENPFSFVHTKSGREVWRCGLCGSPSSGQHLHISCPSPHGCATASSALSIVAPFKAGRRARGTRAHPAAPVLFYQESNTFPETTLPQQSFACDSWPLSSHMASAEYRENWRGKYLACTAFVGDIGKE